MVASGSLLHWLLRGESFALSLWSCSRDVRREGSSSEGGSSQGELLVLPRRGCQLGVPRVSMYCGTLTPWRRYVKWMGCRGGPLVGLYRYASNEYIDRVRLWADHNPPSFKPPLPTFFDYTRSTCTIPSWPGDQQHS